MKEGVGKVYLVGAGPGAAGLLTLRASQVLGMADVVVYDRLVLPRILNFVKRGATFVYVGKQPGRHIATQKQIEELLVHFAKEGKQVVRLKGGDPFVFGRGGEEAETLVNHGVSWEVIPGVTSAISVPAYAGIPVTHRNYGAMFTVISGHRASDDIRSAASQLVAHSGTIVILMGVGQLERIVEDLMTAGLDPSTPVAFIRNGTWGNHQVLTATLTNVVHVVREERFVSPAVIVVGETVTLRDSLCWFERLPLFGRKVIVATDTVGEAMDTANKLEALGAEVFDFALERQIVPAPNRFERLRQALFEKRPVCVFLESVLGAHALMQFLHDNHFDTRKLSNVWIGVKDDLVNQALVQFGFQADLIGKGKTHHFINDSGLGMSIASWLRTKDAEAHDLQVLALYEIPPYETYVNEKNIEQLVHRFIPNAALLATPFYGISHESESVSALIRNWQPYDTELRILSESSAHVLHEILSRNGIRNHEYQVHFDKVRAAL